MKDNGKQRKTSRRKLEHVSISKTVIMMKVADIRPSPENDELYGKFNPDHPDDRALIDDIRKHRKVFDALIVTEDGFIVSGHRRHAACKFLGIRQVPVRRARVRRGDPGYHEFLTSFNKQRVKTIDEVVREQVVLTNPDEAHRRLVEHRSQAAKVDVSIIDIEGFKHRAKISEAKMPFLEAINNILHERRSYWPLTDRQVHYALLSNPPLIHANKPNSRYTNTIQAYKATCDLITRARLFGLIAWNAIDDPTRPIVTWKVYRETSPFIRRQMDDMFAGYYRDLQQSQPNQIEIVGEKNTIDNIIRPVAADFCIPLSIGRGYSSLPPRKKMADRFKKSGKEHLIILMLGDFDPEGQDICHSFARSMRDDFGIDAVKAIKVALTVEQIESLQLPPQMKAKASSSRYEKFVERHGDDVFELEAVPPGELQAILRRAVDSVLDVKLFNAEVDAEKRDAAKLSAIRRSIIANMGNLLPRDDDDN